MLIYRFFWVATTVIWKWNSRTFPGLSRNFLSNFKNLLYQLKYTMLNNFLILYTNSAMSFTRFASGGKSSLRSSFQTLLYWRYNVRLWKFWLFSAVKGENFRPFEDFQGTQPKFKDFPGNFFFANSRTFLDFQEPWQPWFL